MSIKLDIMYDRIMTIQDYAVNYASSNKHVVSAMLLARDVFRYGCNEVLHAVNYCVAHDQNAADYAGYVERCTSFGIKKYKPLMKALDEYYHDFMADRDCSLDKWQLKGVADILQSFVEDVSKWVKDYQQ